MAVANTLAYLLRNKNTAVKSFMIQVPVGKSFKGLKKCLQRFNFFSAYNQIIQLGDYKFNWTSGTLASCLKSMATSESAPNAGFSLSLTSSVALLNVSTDGGKR
jgi:hypothetical protein